MLAFVRVAEVQSFAQAANTLGPLDISMDDRPIDLAEQAVDVVIRSGQLSDSANLIARQIISYPLVVCGAPTYLAQHGNPQHPDQLQQHTCLNFRNRSTGRLYPWSFAIGDEVERYAVSGSVVFDNADAIVQSAIAGLGLSQMPTFLAAAALAEGDLQEVLQPYRPPEMPVWICYLDRRFVAPRIRVFVDFMASQKAVLTAMYRL